MLLGGICSIIGYVLSSDGGPAAVSILGKERNLHASVPPLPRFPLSRAFLPESFLHVSEQQTGRVIQLRDPYKRNDTIDSGGGSTTVQTAIKDVLRFVPAVR